MRVGILGSGVVGQALGRGFASRGHSVKVSSRTPDSKKLKEWVQRNGKNASTGTFAEAAAFGDLLVLAISGTAAEEAIDLAGRTTLTARC